MKTHIAITGMLAGLLLSIQGAHATTFDLPQTDNVLGDTQTTTSVGRQPIADVARDYGVGVYEMLEANPHVDPWQPEPGSQLTIPTRFVLPSGPRKGMVLNLAEMRLYFYHPDEPKVSTFPVGIGKPGWATPIGTTTIVSKRETPTWHVPASIQAEHAKNGRKVPNSIPPGPTNPLGEYAMHTGFAGILMHGTIHPGGIGMRSTHGCIRMFPADIEWVFKHTTVGMQVRVVHEPIKVGQRNGDVYLEAHIPLSDPRFKGSNTQDALIKAVNAVAGKAAEIRWDNAKRLLKGASGIPEQIGRSR